jgi:dipeptidase E
MSSGKAYLEHAQSAMVDFLPASVSQGLFIPYAGVRFSYQNYTEKVRKAVSELGIQLSSIDQFCDPIRAVKEAEFIVVGGGNTFHLLYKLYEKHIIDAIRDRVLEGIPYIGWSAGSNVACPTIMTSNDMPIVSPPSFLALNLVPFQINPHYTEAQISGHHGETREERLQEYLIIHPDETVVGLREGGILEIHGNQIRLIGDNTLRIFKHRQAPIELGRKDPLDFLLINP